MSDAQNQPQTPPPSFPRWLLKVQVFLLRRGWIKGLNKNLMVITTTGRKSGKEYSVPIGYLRPGGEFANDVLAFNIGGGSNWYRNVSASGRASLEIMGQKIAARGEPVTDPAEQMKIIHAYKQNQPWALKRFFGASADAPGSELMKINDRIKFMRFRPMA
ncbi:MAG: nitroreductase family deazaflavin-dependent oxidoreductase [bacterium]|nr:nitroreductase family deazaflavin-dependent oxidoreductase [bacterium]